MSRQMLIIIGVLLLVFGSGIAVGLFLGGTQVNSAASAKSSSGTTSSGFFADSDAEERVNDNTILSDRIRELERELAEQKKANQKATIAERISFYKKYQQHIRLLSFNDENLEINPAMVEILGLSKQEQAAVEAHLKQVQKEMEQLTDADTVVAKQTANNITYDIPADVKGMDLEVKLNGYISADIGADWAGFFMDHSDFDSLYGSFSGFAGQNSEIVINWTNQGGKTMYTYKQSYGGSSSWSDTPSASLPGELQKYLPTNSAP